MTQEEQTMIAELMTLLREERAVLRSGEYARISSIASRKQAIVEALKGTKGSALAEVKEEAKRNEALFDAALRGVNNARARLQQIREGAKGYTGYNQHGQAQRISRGEGTVEIRA